MPPRLNTPESIVHDWFRPLQQGSQTPLLWKTSRKGPELETLVLQSLLSQSASPVEQGSPTPVPDGAFPVCFPKERSLRPLLQRPEMNNWLGCVGLVWHLKGATGVAYPWVNVTAGQEHEAGSLTAARPRRTHQHPLLAIYRHLLKRNETHDHGHCVNN